MTDPSDYRRIYAEIACATGGSTDPRLIDAFTTVPREKFLGPGPWKLRTWSFEDYAETPSDDPVYLYRNELVAIDPKRGLNNGLPGFLAMLIDAMALKPGDRAVHVGTGVGYYTAIMARLVGPTGNILGLEVDPDLARRSQENLADLAHVTCEAASGADLDATDRDAVLINAGATHLLPNWLNAIAPGGRLIVPLTSRRGGIMIRITRLTEGYSAEFLSNVAIFPCADVRDERAEKQLMRALQNRDWKKIASLRRDRHRKAEDCWLHGRGWCLSTRKPAAMAA